MGLKEAIAKAKAKPAFVKREIAGIGTVFIKRLKTKDMAGMAGDGFFPALVAASVHDAIQKGDDLVPAAEPYFADVAEVEALTADIYRPLFAEANEVNWADVEVAVETAEKKLPATPSPAS